MTMVTLGIETSVRTGSVAVCRDGTCLGESPLTEAGRRHAQTLVAEAGRLLDGQGLSPADCETVAVSIGPGSFTGLRVGVVFAKTFAWVTGCRLIAVDTFRCVAEEAPQDVSSLIVIADAHRGELFAGSYARTEDGAFARSGKIEIVPAEAWCRARGRSDVVSGPGVERVENMLAGRCRLVDAERRLPRAAAVARLAEREAAAGAAEDVWTLEPLYLRRSAAEEKWEAEAERRSSRGDRAAPGR